MSKVAFFFKLNENVEELLLDLVPLFKVYYLYDYISVWEDWSISACIYAEKNQNYPHGDPYAAPSVVVPTKDSAHCCIFNRDSLRMNFLCKEKKKNSGKSKHWNIESYKEGLVAQKFISIYLQRKDTLFRTSSHFWVIWIWSQSTLSQPVAVIWIDNSRKVH